MHVVKGDVHAKSAKNGNWNNGFGPSNTAAIFGTLLLCQTLPFQTSPVPDFPLPGFLCCVLSPMWRSVVCKRLFGHV